jgi:four helix bundle protein
MDENELKRRTKRFALDIIQLTNELPPGRTTNVLANQLLRAATSVGANYRSACRGRSKADFISKISIAEEEADECIYWLELIRESQLLPSERINPYLAEAGELTAILTASGRTAKLNRK